MTTLKDNLAKIQAGKPVKKPRTKKKTKKRVNGRAVAKQQVDRKRFCQELIKNNLNATEAYLACRPDVKRSSAGTLGDRLLHEVATVKILTPMLSKLFTDAGIQVDYIFRRWLEMAEGSASDYFRFDDGVPVLDMSDMTPAQERNLKKITISPGQYGTKYSIEVHDAQKAVSEIARHLGLLVDKLSDDSVERIGDMIEKGVARIKANKDLDAWKDLINEDGELIS